MNYTRSTIRAFLWVTGAAIMGSVLSYLFRLLVARSFTVAEYGFIFAIISLTTLFTVLTNLGLGEAITKYTVVFSMRRKEREIGHMLAWAIAIMFSVSLLLFLILYALTPWLAPGYFKSPGTETYLRAFFLAFVLIPIEIIVPSLFAGLRRMEYHALFTVVRTGMLLLACFLLLRAGVGIWAVVAAYFIMYAALYLIFVPLAWRAVAPRRIRMRRAMPRMLLKYGIPVMLTSLTGAVMASIDTVLLTFFSTLEQVGIYQAALPIALLLLFLGYVITTVLVPVLAELWERRKRELMGDAISRIYAYVFVIILPGVIAMVLFPVVLLNLLFGPAYAAGAGILRILAVAALFLLMGTVNTAALLAIGKQHENARAMMVGAVVNVAVSLILIPRYGGLGAGVGTLIAAIVIFAMTTYSLVKVLPVVPPYARWAKTLLCGVVFWAAIRITQIYFQAGQYAKIGLAIVFACAFYVLGMVLLRVVTLKELNDLKDRTLKK